MKNRFFTFAIVTLLALLGGALPFLVKAQSEELQTAREQVTESAQKIDEVADIADRKTALFKIFELTAAEISDLASQEKLEALTELNKKDLSDRASRYLETLNGFASYINLLERQLRSKALTLDDLKQMATDFKKWRSEIYEPQTKDIFDLLLLAQAKSVLQTAQTRFNKIALDVTKLDLIASKSDIRALSKALESSKKNLDTAESFEEQAAEIVLSHTPLLPAKHVTLQQGIGGVFTCRPNPDDISNCEPIFRQTDGSYLVLQFSPALKRLQPVNNQINQGSGILVASAPAYIENAPVGVVEFSIINQPGTGFDVVPDQSEIETAESTPISSLTQPSVQKLIKQTFAEIAQAYQKFFAMSKIAQKY